MYKEERIESLRRNLERKKKTLGIDSDLLYIKGLHKFNNIKEIKYPKSVINARYTYILTDIKGRFDDIKRRDNVNMNKFDYIFDRIISEVNKKTFNDITRMIEGLTEEKMVETLNSYLDGILGKGNVVLSIETDENKKGYAKDLLKRREKALVNTILRFENSNRETNYSKYVTLDVLVKKIAGHVYENINDVFSGVEVSVYDISSVISKSIVLDAVNDYLFNDENFEFMKEKISEYLSCSNDFFSNISKDSFVSILRDNDYEVPSFLKIIIVLSMEEMLKKSFDIYQYEKEVESVSGDYAKTYTTKKNIPKKILDFMSCNDFLSMFGFVEADEECDLGKLRKLSNEFRLLANNLYLPIVKNNSLRFRKLGKLKAAGVYYPSFNTLAVDLDYVSSFVHEMFHMIDSEMDMLSLDSRFEIVLEKYRGCMDEYVDSLNDEKVSDSWYKGKNKYNRDYYRLNTEAFARMGEIYVTEMLGIKSSFAKVDYNSDIGKIVYPKNEELLYLIKEYYDELFICIKDRFDRVEFCKPQKDISESFEDKALINKVEFMDEDEFGISQISFF